MFGLEIGTGVVGVADRALLVTSLLGSCTLFPQTPTSRHGRYKRGTGTPDTSHPLGDDVAGGTFIKYKN